MRAEEITISVPDSRSVTALPNATPIRTPEGELESIVVTVQDMTPLEESQRMRAEFLSMVNHELRKPLISIGDAAATMLDAASNWTPPSCGSSCGSSSAKSTA